MAWTVPHYERKQVDAAGKILRDPNAPLEDFARAFAVLDNWRSAHAFPLNTFQILLRNRARKIDPSATIAQRLKRVPSIVKKLQLQPSMRLSQMQDIGGCRAVLRDVAAARGLRDVYLRNKANALFVSTKDYIHEPRNSGYRSIHLIYRYNCGKSTRQEVFNELQIEVQIRSQLQHAWATAVETVGLLTSKALKSNEGPTEWLELFRKISCLFAYAEGTPPLPGMPERPELVDIVRETAAELRVAERLRGVRVALKLIEQASDRDSRYFLMRLDPGGESLAITGYRDDELSLAAEQYAAAERQGGADSPVDVVLVRAESVKALRKAYPNYFLDTGRFLQRLEQLTGHKKTRVAAG